jgi:hypothetical protein
MVISLARILDGVKLTKEMIEMIALELEVVGSCTALISCAPALGCAMGCVVVSCACVICCVGPEIMRTANPQLKSFEDYAKTYTNVLGAKQYFPVDKPGIIDVSICGILAPFVHAGHKSVNMFLGSSGRSFEWYNKMKPDLPQDFLGKIIGSIFHSTTLLNIHLFRTLACSIANGSGQPGTVPDFLRPSSRAPVFEKMFILI